jgi:hypothetical protein
MGTEELVAEILKVGVSTLISSKIAKAIGQKDIAEIIAGSGLCILGIDLAQLVIPIIKDVAGFIKGVGDFFGNGRDFMNGTGLKSKIILDRVLNK